MTGLWAYLRDECSEALQEAVDEGYKVVWIDCGVWRWNRYICCPKGEEFRGEVEWDDEDKRRMREMLQRIPEECTKRLWTSLFPKNCLVLALFICCCFCNDITEVFAEDVWLVNGRFRCRSEGEIQEKERIIDCGKIQNFGMDDELDMIAKAEVKRIEIPGFGLPFFILGYLERVTELFG